MRTWEEEADDIADSLNEDGNEEAIHALNSSAHWLGSDDVVRQRMLDRIKARTTSRAAFDAFVLEILRWQRNRPG